MSNSIQIRNVYYMLSYAYQVLTQNGYKHIETESFENIADMFAAIIQRGIEIQLKKYLNREYITETSELSTLRGKIEINDSINQMSFLKKKLVCSYDEFSIDSYMNRILKSVMLLLIKSDISRKQKQGLKSLLIYFSNVQVLDLHHINWKIRYNQNTQSYQMLIGICYLLVQGLLQTQKNGSSKLMVFLDEQRMSHLYEKFVLEYYRKHFPEFNASPSYVEWAADGELQYLPALKTDITLTDKKQNKILIIDTKFYTHSMQYQFDKYSYHSGNLYQILSYVKNKESCFSGEVSGMLLYAKTDETVTPNQNLKILGNNFCVRTLDLNTEFSQIKNELDGIINCFFFPAKR